MKKLTKAEQKLLNDLTDRAIYNGQQIITCKVVSDPKQADAVKDVLNQRGERYGDFTDHARLAQQLQDCLRNHTVKILQFSGTNGLCISWDYLSPVQKQALTVICDKLARILNGDPNYDDNWIDIQGYARLAQERLPQSDVNTSE